MMTMIHLTTSRVTATLLCLCATFTLAMNTSCKKSDDVPAIHWVTSIDGLKLRAMPDARSSVVADIPYLAEVKFEKVTGEVVDIHGILGKWSEISYQGKKGFVFGGFLSSERPETPVPGSDADLINFAKKYYVNQHKLDFGLNIQDLNHESLSAIREKFARDTTARKRVGKFAILTHKNLSDGSGLVMERETLWVLKANSWHLIEYSYFTPNAWQLLYLNNDNLIDALSFNMHDSTTMRSFLGVSDEEIKLIGGSEIEFFADYDRERREFRDLKIGKCGETRIPSDYFDSELQKSVPVTWTFDCEKNQFVKMPRQETPRAE
ncbi:MAG TPA: hypothetical protein PKY31_13260 [Spirochaetota bacterium]|nr:hypothetical protein [Spirochaetota bacterium]